MGTSQWTADLSVGHDVLDEHHRTLFDLLTELSAGMVAGSDEIWARGIGDRLMAYVDYHFREEEALLDGLGQRPLAEVLTDVQDFLADWLSHHIEIEDFEYKPYLSRHG